MGSKAQIRRFLFIQPPIPPNLSQIINFANFVSILIGVPVARLLMLRLRCIRRPRLAIETPAQKTARPNWPPSAHRLSTRAILRRASSVCAQVVALWTSIFSPFHLAQGVFFFYIALY